MLTYSLGDMKSSSGSALWYDVKAECSECSGRILEKLIFDPAYLEVSGRLASPRTELYFRRLIADAIYPFVRQAFVIQWYKRNNKSIPAGELCVKVPDTGIFRPLLDYWDVDGVNVKLTPPFYYNLSDRSRLRSAIKKQIMKCRRTFGAAQERNTPGLPSSKNMVACHYIEGLDPARRNDLNWFVGSGIDAGRILVYFDRSRRAPSHEMAGGLISRKVTDRIERQGMRWVALERDIIEAQGSEYWAPAPISKDSLIRVECAENSLTGWVVDASNDLLREVHYWGRFYEHFSIKVHYVPEEGFVKNIAQAIAFDVKKDGVLVGKQRSEISYSLNYMMGNYPKHVFFAWNEWPARHLGANLEKIEKIVITGYPNDLYNKREDYCASLRRSGAKFVIALYDEMPGPENNMSEGEIANFYEAFLRFVLDDRSIGLMIKSKKPSVIESLPSIHPLLKKAEETGRCIVMKDIVSRLASDASFGADIAIGCGISSAVVESVIAGCKGIHYDITGQRSVDYYGWGHGKVIFDDMGELLSALKKIKEGRGGKDALGDWSCRMDSLDSFRDGKGGQRMGSYMRWLLEAFDKRLGGHDRAIEYADSNYTARWGADKVIDMREGVTV
ncbi:MAG: hypothetical protein V1682_00780 [Candidatus Omnitrophota bacterium]